MNHRDHFADLKDKAPGHVLTSRDVEILKTVWHQLAGYKAAYELETHRSDGIDFTKLPFNDCKNQPGVRAAKAAAARRLFNKGTEMVAADGLTLVLESPAIKTP